MLFHHDDLRLFTVRTMQAVNVSESDAEAVADVLICADLRGIDSHGIARLRRYVDGVRSGRIAACVQPVIRREGKATVAIDAGNGLGQPVSRMAMNVAIRKAFEFGLGMATVCRSNHFGIAGYYAQTALAHGLFAIVGTNASPQVAPTHGASPMFGTNPLAVAFPTGGDVPFVLDAATSVVSRGKLERLEREGRQAYPGCAIGPDGQPATDIAQLVGGLQRREGYALLPLGGAGEQLGGHKGYGLALLVEILSGPLAGALWGRHVYGDQGAGLGHFFLCGRVDAFLPVAEFRAQTDRMFAEIRSSPKASGAERIYLPGEREYETEQLRRVAGIPLPPAVVEDLHQIADEVGVRPPPGYDDRASLGQRRGRAIGWGSDPHMRATTKLRRLLTSGPIGRAAGAHDPLSALVVEQCRFDAVWASSFTISASHGLPDMSLLTMTELLSAAAEMAANCTIPVLADCDTGFGGAANMAHLVERYEAAGVAGVCIEDKVFPKTNSFVNEGHELVDADEFGRKIRAGAEAKSDADFVIVARTEALITGASMDEALERAKSYVAAGADALLIHSKRNSPDEVIQFLNLWGGLVPVIVVPTTYYSWNAQDAQQAGAAMVVYANHALRACIQSMTDVLAEIRAAGESTSVEARISSVSRVFSLTRLERWMEVNR